MKKALLITLLLIVFQVPSFSANKKMVPATGVQNALPNIFIYSIPDDTKSSSTSSDDTKSSSDEEVYIEDTTTSEENADDEIILNMKQEEPENTEKVTDDDESFTIGASVLKGYAQYVEDSNSIYLIDDNDNYVLNIKTPQKISASKGLN